MYKIIDDLLEYGDIILGRSDSIESRIIQSRSASQYSHVMLYVSETTYIDSLPKGVQANNIQRLFFENPEDVLVLRLKDKSLSPRLETITNFARSKVGTEYSLHEARKALNNVTYEATYPNRQFCTRFVSQAYESAGILLMNNPDYSLPEDFIKSHLLEKIEGIIRKASDEEIKGAESESILEVQKKLFNDNLRAIRLLSKKDIQTLPQITELVISNPEFDDEITKIVSSSGYLDIMDIDYQKNPWHYDKTQFVAHYVTPDNMRYAANKILRIERPMNHGLEYTLNQLQQLMKVHNRNYLKMEEVLYKRLINYSNIRLNLAMDVLKDFM